MKRRQITAGLVGTIALAQWGCAVTRVGSPSLEEFRGRLGVVGVTSPSEVPKTALPSSGRGAAAAEEALAAGKRGAVVGVAPGYVVTAAGAMLMPIPFIGAPLMGLGLGLAAAGAAAGGTLGALGGALHGATNADVPAKELGAALKSTVEELNLQEALRDGVLQAATRPASLTFVALPAGPSRKGGDAVDAILEVALRRIELTREGEGPNPPVAIVASARGRLIRSGDGREVARHTVTHRSVTLPYADWAADDAARFREALAAAPARMAEEIVDVIIVGTEPPAPTPAPPPRRPEPASGPRYRGTSTWSTSEAAKQNLCRARHLEWRSDWRSRLPEYRACLSN